jgi:redox-sensitive bicupin YhaK (pirin superfamily)
LTPILQTEHGLIMTTLERIGARTADLGEGLRVSRVLPTRERRMVGAWCFLDHAGPVRFEEGRPMLVGAHPHTGLQTFTWLIEGEVLHRDSLGSEQIIRPGQVNLMTAGRGIVHTEDSLTPTLHAAQLWIALPPEEFAREPAFDHYPQLPTWQERGVTLTLLAGRYRAQEAPAKLYSRLIGLDLSSEAGGEQTLRLNPAFEHALLPLKGEVELEGEVFAADEFAFLGSRRESIDLTLRAGSRALLIGGEPFEHQVVMWWNFVAHSRADIVQAQHDWETGSARFGVVPHERGARMPAPKLPWPSSSRSSSAHSTG